MVGGDPGGIESGGDQLKKASGKVDQIATGVRTAAHKASANAGEAALESAIERFSAAFRRYTAAPDGRRRRQADDGNAHRRPERRGDVERVEVA